MSKLTDLQAQVIRLQTRLNEVGDAEKLTNIIKDMQIQAKLAQERLEHARKEASALVNAAQAQSSTAQHDLFKERQEHAKTREELRRSGKDVERLRQRIAEIASPE
jgi:predicted  nucleic acid-binding Zn-ribbon protein